jgi:hypothetical protein
MDNKKRKEPTWKEALKIAHKQTSDKLAPMKRAMLEIYIKRLEKEVNKKLALVKQVIYEMSREKREK